MARRRTISAALLIALASVTVGCGAPPADIAPEPAPTTTTPPPETTAPTTALPTLEELAASQPTTTTAAPASTTTTTTPPPPVGVVTPTGATPRLDGVRVALVSDSILAGFAGDIVARQLTAAGAIVSHRDHRGGMPLYQHPGLVETFDAKQHDVVIGVFGYNDTANTWVAPTLAPTVAATFNRAVDAANASATCWVWPTIGTDFTTYTSLASTRGRDLADAAQLATTLNAQMTDAAATAPYLRVLDWQPLIDANRATWNYDGLHLSETGASQFANAAVEAVAACP